MECSLNLANDLIYMGYVSDNMTLHKS